ncbi:DNA repair ATPase [Streptomyces sp. NPDC101175]|uniref:DNA repair ATPase n=1 Tax=Streptomyces sp. NPDC101175 TaxID=3366123 RepID=UPI0038370236
MTTGLDTGTYEVLRDRLAAQAAELARRAEALNSRRVEEFGSTRLDLAGTGRLTTEHPATPRDVVAVGDALLFGYQTSPGVTRETAVADVLGLYDRRELRGLPEDAVPGLLDDPEFVREFTALHRYYRQARLLRLRRFEGKLLAVFRTGEKADDIRVLRWALTDDGRAATFLDAHGERDHVFPPPYDFDWTGTGREDLVAGRHPHVRIQDGLYVDTLGGTLTVKVEDNTETGEGIYAEPVDEPLQSPADAEISYARVGALVLLRVRPYKEDAHRHLVFNTLTKRVVRLDGIGLSCQRLPEEQGIVFPGGYCLATGECKTFETATDGLELERIVRSPNGEDVLFGYRARASGRSLLLPYNMIRKEVAAPLPGRGWALFEDGMLVVLGEGEAARVHPVRLWRTPFVSDTRAAAAQLTGSGPLFRVGNADLVRGISDCLSVTGAVVGMEPAAEVYEALVAACVRAADTHHWLADAELGDLRGPLEEVRDTAEQVLTEFETVRTLTARAADALTDATDRTTSLVRRLRGEAPRDAAGWVGGLTELRRAQGHLLTLKEMRYADTARIEQAAAEVEADLGAFGQRAVAFLAREDAFAGHHELIESLVAESGALAKAAEAAPVAARLDELTAGLRTVTEVVAGLDIGDATVHIGDATVRTSILERVAEVLGGVNRARATLDARRAELRDREGRAEFAAEFALLAQSVTGALADAATPEACDTQLALLLVRLENLEARFADFDDFLAELTGKRVEIHETLSARKQTLVDQRARRAEQLSRSAAQVLETVGRRAGALADADAVNTYFASDPMVTRIRRTADQLRELGEGTRAQELTGRLTAAHAEAVRALRDRADLFADGGRTLRLGRHRFAVHTEPLDLTLVPSGEGLAFALTSTDYRSPVRDPEFAATRPYWDRPLPSESPSVYRAEHLAARLLDEHGAPALAQEADLGALVRRAAQESYDEGYERGVHDHDATAILTALLRRYEDAGLLRHQPAARARALLFWTHRTNPRARENWTRRARSLARARDLFGPTPADAELRAELAAETGSGGEAAAAYLLDELTSAPEGFVISTGARALLDKFRRAVGSSAYDDDLTALADDLPARHQLVEAWLTAYTTASGTRVDPGDLAEAVAAELCPGTPRYESDAQVAETVGGLLGSHPRLVGGELRFRLDELLSRTREFRARDVPGHRAYQRRRTALVAAERGRLRLDEYRPRVLSSFVRGRLVDEVYLPLIGDNLARQLGTAGEPAAGAVGTGGLLLLISPPGYGKTTLMEYVADRLGLVLVKVSGPALGHGVTSLDPAEAPNATARQEVEKVDFALAAGNNVLLHLDDIQHTSPELLQKFITLCDATRRMEGVWEGAPHTYDLRGKRFAVCMTGNPYTESGSRFRIPDMLANRADVWNLGDVLTGKEALFALSFIENALTSNPVLAPLAGRDRDDLDLLIRLARDDTTARADRLSYACDPTELARTVAVLRQLLAARDTVLAVNTAYMASAATTEEARTEPPFRLQGSYRSMNRIARRIEPVMNSRELSAVLDDHYSAEAQTLGAEAEANLLKLAELRGTLTVEQAARWGELKAGYRRGRQERQERAGGAVEARLSAAQSALWGTHLPSSSE